LPLCRRDGHRKLLKRFGVTPCTIKRSIYCSSLYVQQFILKLLNRKLAKN